MATIPRFTLVQVDAVSNGKAKVRPWTPSASEQPGLSSGHKVVGMTMSTSEVNEPVTVMQFGYMRAVTEQNSESWTVGDLLWAKSDGSVTKTRPAAPLPQVFIGMIFQDEGTGGPFTVFVNVKVLPSLGELSGVSMETPADKDVFIYKDSTDVWEPRQIDHGADLAGLTDDDHTQYLKEKASGGLAAEIPEHTHDSAAEAGALNSRRWSWLMGD